MVGGDDEASTAEMFYDDGRSHGSGDGSGCCHDCEGGGGGGDDRRCENGEGSAAEVTLLLPPPPSWLVFDDLTDTGGSAVPVAAEEEEEEDDDDDDGSAENVGPNWRLEAEGRSVDASDGSFAATRSPPETDHPPPSPAGAASSGRLPADAAGGADGGSQPPRSVNPTARRPKRTEGARSTPAAISPSRSPVRRSRSTVEKVDDDCDDGHGGGRGGGRDRSASTAAARSKSCPPPPPSPSLASSIRHHASVTLPLAARELVSATFRRAYHYTRLAYYSGGDSLGVRGIGFATYRRATDLGNNAAGYRRDAVLVIEDGFGETLWDGSRAGLGNGSGQGGGGKDVDEDRGKAVPELHLPPFSSLSWVDRQLVKEWRTFDVEDNRGGDHAGLQKTVGAAGGAGDEDRDDEDRDEDAAYDAARLLKPRPLPRPPRENASSCYACRRPFSSALLRHHCRLCGRSYCQAHSAWSHRLPHLGYDADVAERVCAECKGALEARDLAERIAWRMARCRDHLAGNLTPYFETGVDTAEDAALRLARAAIAMARSVPLGAQATVAVETLEVLRKHGLKGVYGLILRKEFMAAADLLCRVTGIDKRAWPLSVHELSAAVFYALAQHRLLRGMDPEREHRIHAIKEIMEDECGERRDCRSDGSAPVAAAGAEGTDMAQRAMDPAGKGCNVGNYECGTEILPSVDDNNKGDEEEEGGDTIVWGNEVQQPTSSGNSVLDETDAFDPMAESVADMLAMADRDAVQTQERRTGVDLSCALQERDAGPDGTIITTAVAGEPTKSVGGDNAAVPNEDKDAPMDGRPRVSPPPSFAPVCEHVDDPLLSSLIFYAPMALNFIYATSATDMQLLAAQQGWRLLYAHLDQDPGPHAGGSGGHETVADRPASALFVHDERRIACFAVRGTATINDVVTDIRAMPVPFPPESDEFADRRDSRGCSGGGTFDGDWTPVFRGQGLALCGMAGASVNLFRENVDTLLLLARRGYKIRIVGHSLGGGVAALLGSLVRRHFERRAQGGDEALVRAAEAAAPPPNASHESTEPEAAAAGRDCPTNPYSAEMLETNDLLRVYSYGSPACVDAALADYARSYVTNCVMHDDVVPRLTPTSIRALLKHLLHIRETWVKVHLGDDVTAYAERVRMAWAPRWRQSFTLLKSSSRGLRKCKRGLWRKADRMRQRRARALDRGTALCGGVFESGNNRCGRENVRREDCKENASGSNSDFAPPEGSSEIFAADDRFTEQEQSNHEVDCQQGIDVDGDLFYEAEENLLESDEESGSETNGAGANGSMKLLPRHSEEEEDKWVPFDEPAMAKKERTSMGAVNVATDPSRSGAADKSSSEKDQPRTESPPAVMLEETPLPRMFIPGRIVHIYTHRGGYRVAFVPRQFRELRRISLAGNMLKDHTSMAYYEGLLEVKTVRRAEFDLPEWTGFGEESTCSCCASRFTWASTSDSEAQEARDKHNCRSCGSLVCDPCSKNRIALPSVGITTVVRVCDRCYNDMGSILMGGSHDGTTMERSFLGSVLEVTERERGSQEQSGNGGGHENNRSAGETSKCPLIVLEDAKNGNVNSNPAKVVARDRRQKRSVVVDELASRIPSVSTC